jgi:membrane-associated phospholipid phosphatase
MRITLNGILFCVAAAVVLLDTVWVLCDQFKIDTQSYFLLLIAVGALSGGSIFYSRVRHDMAISAMLGATAFLVAFPAAACLLTYLSITVSGPRIDNLLAAGDHEMGFNWLAAMALAADHPLANEVLRLAYNSIISQTVILVLLLGWRKRPEQIYQLCLAIAIGALTTIAIWTAFPSFGAFSVFHMPPEVITKLHIVDDTAYANQLALMLTNGPGYISPKELRGLIGFPSYHTIQAVVLIWYAREFPYVRWISLGLNLLVLASTIVQGGHHLIDVIAGIIVAASSIAIADRITATAVSRGPVIRMPSVATSRVAESASA